MIYLNIEFEKAIKECNKLHIKEIIDLSDNLCNNFPKERGVMTSIWKNKAERMHKYFLQKA